MFHVLTNSRTSSCCNRKNFRKFRFESSDSSDCSYNVCPQQQLFPRFQGQCLSQGRKFQGRNGLDDRDQTRLDCPLRDHHGEIGEAERLNASRCLMIVWHEATMLVKEGDTVKLGQPLLLIKRTKASSSHRQGLGQLSRSTAANVGFSNRL